MQKALFILVFFPTLFFGQLSEKEAIKKGNARVELGQYTAALQYYNLALLDNPKSPRAHNNIGNIYERAGYHFKASSFYSKAIKYDTTNISYYYNRALSRYAGKGYLGASGDLKKALSLDSAYGKAYELLALCYSKQGKFNKALSTIETALQHGNNQAFFYQTRAEIRIDMKQVNMVLVIEDINKAIKLNPSIAYFYKFRANIYNKIWRRKLAKKDMKTYTKMVKEKNEYAENKRDTIFT